jgi:bifunctional UDP-N-acetylglucosamine pyrophosphorylase/glucosamine-1-phosphate N-acetyltransferase
MVRAVLRAARPRSAVEPFDQSIRANKEPMGTSPLAVVILAAGIGTRMRSRKPKVLHALAGRPMIGHLAASVARLRPATVVLVVGPGMEAVTEMARRAAPGLKIVSAVQRDRRGTGHAVQQARRALKGHRGDVLVLLGDGPLVEADTMRRLVAARRAGEAAVAVLGFRTPGPSHYGRMVLGADGKTLERIVEARDTSEEEKRITLCNSGVIAVDGAVLFELLSKLQPDNAKGELYLTDIVGIARARGLRCTYTEAEFVAINSRAELAAAEAILQNRLRQAAMDGGATLIDPATVWLSYDTAIGQDVVIGPNVFFGPGVTIGDGAEIRSFCHIEGATVAPGAIVGPFARLRPGAEIGPSAHIGNFVEVKNARIGEGAKANHLAYLGDARVGARANIGAGTIFCNYDGYLKHLTDIGPDVFIGSNATLVAPVKVGARAFVAAGSTVTDPVPADALAFGRARQTTRKQAGAVLRARLKRAKKQRKKKG